MPKNTKHNSVKQYLAYRKLSRWEKHIRRTEPEANEWVSVKAQGFKKSRDNSSYEILVALFGDNKEFSHNQIRYALKFTTKYFMFWDEFERRFVQKNYPRKDWFFEINGYDKE